MPISTFRRSFRVYNSFVTPLSPLQPPAILSVMRISEVEFPNWIPRSLTEAMQPRGQVAQREVAQKSGSDDPQHLPSRLLKGRNIEPSQRLLHPTLWELAVVLILESVTNGPTLKALLPTKVTLQPCCTHDQS